MTFLERRQRVTDPDGPLLLLELKSDSFAEPLRIVNDNQDWTSNGVLYTAFPFSIRLPDDVEGQAPRAQIVVGNVGLPLTEDLEALGPNELVTATIRITDRADPNVIEHTLILPLTQVSVTSQAVSASAGVDYLMRQQAVRLRYTPYISPGVF